MAWIAALYALMRALALAALSGSVQAQSPADADDRAWSNARELGTAEAYQRYLELFPVGRHVEEAFRSLVEEQIETEIGPTRGVDRDIDLY